jgi:hypothetical protein
MAATDATSNNGIVVRGVPGMLASFIIAAALICYGANHARTVWADHVIWYALLVMGFLIFVSACGFVFALSRLWLALRMSPSQNSDPLVLECGRLCSTRDRASVRADRSLLSGVTCRWMIPALGEVKLQDGLQVFMPRERGCSSHLVRQFIVQDLLELFKLTLTHDTEKQILIIPAAARLSKCPQLPRQTSGDSQSSAAGNPVGDLLDIRDYREGEPARRIIWRVVAKTSGARYVTRTAEDASSPGRAYFFLPGNEDESGAELARIIVEGRLDSEPWWFACAGSKGLLAGDQQKKDALEWIARSAEYRHAAEALIDGEVASWLTTARQRGVGALVLLVGQPRDRGDTDELVQRVLRCQQIAANASMVLLVAMRPGQVIDPELAKLSLCGFEVSQAEIEPLALHP